MQDFPSLKAGIRDFKAYWRRNLGLKARSGRGMPKTNIGITGMHENKGQDDGIK